MLLFTKYSPFKNIAIKTTLITLLIALACLTIYSILPLDNNKKILENFLVDKLTEFESLAAAGKQTSIRLKYASDPVIEAVAIWDENDTLIFPDSKSLYKITDHAYIKNQDRFRTLRKQEKQMWERSDATTTALLYCKKNTYNTCLQLNTNELSKTLSINKDELSKAIFTNSFDTRYFIYCLLLLFVTLFFGTLKKRFQPQNQSAVQVTPSHIFIMGDMQIDKQRMTISRGSYKADITVRDLNILCCLYEHPEEVLSKDKLYDAGWGRDFIPSSRSLEQHIATLRKKLDPERTRQALIVTVHGMGYRFPADSLETIKAS